MASVVARSFIAAVRRTQPRDEPLLENEARPLIEMQPVVLPGPSGANVPPEEEEEQRQEQAPLREVEDWGEPPRRMTFVESSFAALRGPSQFAPAAAVGAAAAVFRGALEVLKLPCTHQLLQKVHLDAQHFLARRLCLRRQRLWWIGWASLIWGIMLTFISLSGTILSLTGQLREVLENVTGNWFAKFGMYFMPYLAALHVAQIVTGIQLLLALQLAGTSPQHRRGAPKGKCLMCILSTLGVIISTISLSSLESNQSQPDEISHGQTASARQTQLQPQTQPRSEHVPAGQTLQGPSSLESGPSSLPSETWNIGLSSNVLLDGGTQSDLDSTSMLSQNLQSTQDPQIARGTSPTRESTVSSRRPVSLPVNLGETFTNSDHPLQLEEEEEFTRSIVTLSPTSPIAQWAKGTGKDPSLRPQAQSLSPGGSLQRKREDFTVHGQSTQDVSLPLSLETAGRSLRISIENLPDSASMRRGEEDVRSSDALNPDPRCFVPWLWTAAATLATYTVASTALYGDGDAAAATTIGSAIAMATPCVSDVLAEMYGVPEKPCGCDDEERLLDNVDLPFEDIETTVQTRQMARSTQTREREVQDASPGSHRDSLQAKIFDERSSLLH